MVRRERLLSNDLGVPNNWYGIFFAVSEEQLKLRGATARPAGYKIPMFVPPRVWFLPWHVSVYYSNVVAYCYRFTLQRP